MKFLKRISKQFFSRNQREHENPTQVNITALKFQSNLITNPFLQTMQGFFKYVCEEISVHGVRYFTEQGLPWTERCSFWNPVFFIRIIHEIRNKSMNRLWWIIAVGLSVLFCITSISKLSLDWLGSPARTSTENPTPISAIPFPTTTICLEIKVHANNVNMTADQFDDASCHTHNRSNIE